MPDLPQRQRLYHSPPPWVAADALYFVTVCCARRGVPQLNTAAIFSVMVSAVEHYQSAGKWHPALFLAMPDHWHALVAFSDTDQMQKMIRDWKRYVAKQTGIVWQDGFFEHRLRTRQSAEEKWHYIHLNPVRQGLVAEPSAWPYVWTPTAR